MLSMITSTGAVFSTFVGQNTLVASWFALLALCLASEYYFKYYKENKNA